MQVAADKTILVVDDEPNVRLFLQTALEDAGFHVVTAGDGEEALGMIRTNRPDLISLDLVMPRKSGRKLLYELRKDRELSRIPVLIVTAHARDELGKSDLEDILESSVMSGPGIYLEKPVKPDSYVRAVQRALGIEETESAADAGNLKDELRKKLRDATPEAIRRALGELEKD